MSKDITVEDITGPEFNPDQRPPTLQELLEKDFRQLESLFLAAQDLRYQYDKKRYGIRDGRIMTLQRALESIYGKDHGRINKKINDFFRQRRKLPEPSKLVVSGPFNYDTIKHLQAACQFLFDNGKDFRKIDRRSGSTDYVCTLPCDEFGKHKVAHSRDYIGEYEVRYKITHEGRDIEWGGGYAPSIFENRFDPYYFRLNTTGMRTFLRSPRENHPVMKDILTVVKAVMQYAKEQAEK